MAYLLINTEIEWFARSSTGRFGASASQNISFQPYCDFALSMQDAQWAYNRYYRMQHQQHNKFQGKDGNVTDLALVPICTVHTVRSSGKSGDSFNAFLEAPAAGCAPQLSTQEAKKALIQWIVTLAAIPCGCCPTLVILVMFVGMEIGSVGMPEARYLTGPSTSSTSHTPRISSAWQSFIEVDFAIASHDTNARTPHRVIDRSHGSRSGGRGDQLFKSIGEAQGKVLRKYSSFLTTSTVNYQDVCG